MSWRRKTFDELPVLSVRGPELRRALRTVIIAWMYGIIWMTCVSGSRITLFANMVGFTDFEFGVLAALPFIATFAQLAAAVLIERTGLRKFQFLQCATIHRLLWVAVAVVPFVLPVPSRAAVWTTLGILAISWFLSHLATPAWLMWMGDIIPRRIRGRFLANRARITQAVHIPAVIALAWGLDRITRDDAPMTAEQQKPLLIAICIAFAVGAVFGAVDILLFRRMREVFRPVPSSGRTQEAPRPDERRARRLRRALDELLLGPLKDKGFRQVAGFYAVAFFAMACSGPFFWKNCLENLRFGQLGADGLFLVIGPLAGIASTLLWGKVIDRWGRRPVLIIAGVCVVMSVMPYFFASPQTPNPQWLVGTVNGFSGWIAGLFGGRWEVIGPEAPLGAWLIISLSVIIGGTGWTGINLAREGIMMGFADGPGRSRYVAAQAVIISGGGMLGGLTGGLLAQSLSHLHDSPIVIGPFLWNNWHATFVLSLAARITALVLALRMAEPGAARVRDIVRFARGNVYNMLAPRLAFAGRLFGRNWLRTQRRRRQESDHDEQ
ncbi:MAG: MFS transporter [Phycisphaerae bacterium]